MGQRRGPLRQTGQGGATRGEGLKDINAYNAMHESDSAEGRNANYTDLVNSYWDRYSNHQVENCTRMHRVNVGTMVGASVGDSVKVGTDVG